jgi:predicted ribosomally synthesized peptide with SipW-like signal peptide
VDTKRKRIALTIGAALTVASIVGGAASLALFTSTATVDSNTFTAGTVIITTDHPATAIVSYANMAPGDLITAPLLVSNTGTLALRYSLSSVATNVDTKSLKDQLVLTVKSGVTTCSDAAYAATGVIEYTGDLDFTNGKLIGDVATGQDGGAFPTAGADRVLAASASETLCFHVSLAGSTGDAYQGAATTATFTFSAEQTKNN